MTNGTGTGERAQTARPRIAAMERGRFAKIFRERERERERAINFSLILAGPGPARYSLPGLTGSAKHDTTRKLYPCYSFGMKLGSTSEGEIVYIISYYHKSCTLLLKATVLLWLICAKKTLRILDANVIVVH